jgi:hypothetical protein
VCEFIAEHKHQFPILQALDTTQHRPTQTSGSEHPKEFPMTTPDPPPVPPRPTPTTESSLTHTKDHHRDAQPAKPPDPSPHEIALARRALTELHCWGMPRQLFAVVQSEPDHYEFFTATLENQPHRRLPDIAADLRTHLRSLPIIGFGVVGDDHHNPNLSIFGLALISDQHTSVRRAAKIKVLPHLELIVNYHSAETLASGDRLVDDIRAAGALLATPQPPIRRHSTTAGKTV